MGEFFFAIAVIVAIVRGIYRFLRWAARSLKGDAPAAAPPRPMPERTAAPGSLPSPNVGRGNPAPMPRPPARSPLPPPVVSREATTSSFRDEETRLLAAEPAPLDSLRADDSQPVRPAPPPLFGSTSDLVRALILQEVLGPPLSKRRPPSD